MKALLACPLGLAMLAAGGCASAPAPWTSPSNGDAMTAAYSAAEQEALRARAGAELLTLGADPAAQLRANSVEALGRGAPELAAPLVDAALTDPNEGVRAVAAVVAGKLGLRDTAPQLRVLLGDESIWVRMSAVFGLWALDEQVDPTPLSRALMSGPPRQRAQAAFFLGEMGNPSALPMLADAANRSIPLASANEVRMFELQVDQARVKLGELELTQPIRAALYPTRPEELELTVLAVQLIGELGDQGAASELINLTARLDGAGNAMPAEVQIAAAAALARLGNARGEFLVLGYLKDDFPPIRAQAAWALGELGNPANLGRLERLLDDQSALVRLHAAGAILLLTGARAADLVTDLAETANDEAP